MRKQLPFLLLLALIWTVSACKSQSPDKNGSSSTKTVNEYSLTVDPELGEALSQKIYDDAARLAARAAISSTRGERDGFVNPTAHKQYFEDLVAIQKFATKQEGAPDLAKIHTFPNPTLHQLSVTLEKEAAFGQNWLKGEIATGDAKLDAFLEKYAFSIVNKREGMLGISVTLESSRNLITPWVAADLTKFEGIRFAEASAPIGDGNNIEAVPGGKNGRGYSFSEGWGDCPSGCIHRRHYTYYVNYDGSVYYVGASGDSRETEGSEREEE